MAELIWQREDYIGDNIDLIAALWKFEESKEFKYNLKYKIQATDYSKKNGETILRYDNANDSHAARHHKHTDDKNTEPIQNPFQDVNPDETEEVVKAMEELWQRFLQEVKNQIK